MCSPIANLATIRSIIELYQHVKLSLLRSASHLHVNFDDVCSPCSRKANQSKITLQILLACCRLREENETAGTVVVKVVALTVAVLEPLVMHPVVPSTGHKFAPIPHLLLYTNSSYFPSATT